MNSTTCLIPRTYVRHRRQLRALLIGHQAWFSARDLSRLISRHFSANVPAMLDDDQSQRAMLRNANGGFDEELLMPWFRNQLQHHGAGQQVGFMAGSSPASRPLAG